MNISPQTLQSISMRTCFLSAAASAVAGVIDQNLTVTPGVCHQKRISSPDSDDNWDNNYDIEEVVDAHFSVAASAAALATDQLSTVTLEACCQKPPPDSLDDINWDGMSPGDDIEKVVDDDSADGEYLDYFWFSAEDADDT